MILCHFYGIYGSCLWILCRALVSTGRLSNQRRGPAPLLSLADTSLPCINFYMCHTLLLLARSVHRGRVWMYYLVRESGRSWQSFFSSWRISCVYFHLVAREHTQPQAIPEESVMTDSQCCFWATQRFFFFFFFLTPTTSSIDWCGRWSHFVLNC